MFKHLWSSLEQKAQQRLHEMYPHSGVNSAGSSRPMTPAASTSSSCSIPVSTDEHYTSSGVSPADPEGVISVLKDRSVDDLKRLLSDKDAYQDLLLSLEPVRTQNRVRDELRNETMQLARENLDKEPQITDLRNQCSIIRTTELASAQEKLHNLEKKKEETPLHSPSSLVHQLQDAMNKTDEESEALHRKLLDRELDLTEFIQKYKKTRHTYHKQALTHLAMKSSPTSCA